MAESDSEYHGPERRNNDPVLNALNKLHVEMADRLARIETKQEAMVPRCNSHAIDIEALNKRAKTIEEAIDYKEDEETIHDRTKALEKRRDTVDGVLRLIGWVSGIGAAAYGALLFLAKALLPHSDKVVK